MEPLHKRMLRIKAMSREWIKGQNFQKQQALTEVEDKLEVVYDEIKKVCVLMQVKKTIGTLEEDRSNFLSWEQALWRQKQGSVVERRG